MKLTLNGLFDSNNRRPESVEAEFVVNDVTYKTKLTDILEEPDFTYPIGSGRFGTVYRKKHRLSGLVMAEKIVSKGTANLDRYAETEKQLWKNCKHEHLVNHYGAIDTAMNVHLYFELMNTCLEKLQERLKKRQGNNYRFPEEVLAKIAYSTYSALWYLKEAHSVIHRDIKPSNILVGNDGSIKVTDFGLARKLVDSRAYTKGIGCLGYISPERIERTEGGYGTPADIWSIGISVIELATGKHPILSQAVRETGELVELDILVVIVDQDPPRLTGDRFSENLKNFVERCLQKKASDRIRLGDSHPFLGRIPTDESMLQWCRANHLLV